MKNYQKTKTSQYLHFWELKNNNIYVVLDETFLNQIIIIKQKTFKSYKPFVDYDKSQRSC